MQRTQVTWVPSKHGIFNMKSSWFAIREVYPRQEWWDVVWFKKYTPWGGAFILWLAILQTSSTKDRMLTWGLVPDATCVLCTMVVWRVITIYFLNVIIIKLLRRNQNSFIKQPKGNESLPRFFNRDVWILAPFLLKFAFLLGIPCGLGEMWRPSRGTE